MRGNQKKAAHLGDVMHGGNIDSGGSELVTIGLVVDETKWSSDQHGWRSTDTKNERRHDHACESGIHPVHMLEICDSPDPPTKAWSEVDTTIRDSCLW